MRPGVLTVTAALSLLLSSWETTHTHGEEAPVGCQENAVVMAMTTCQGERQKLSYASQLNNTDHLCRALKQYSDCMAPRIQGCQGPAKIAFDVITSKYASAPYNCQLDQSPDKPDTGLLDVQPRSTDIFGAKNATYLLPKPDLGGGGTGQEVSDTQRVDGEESEELSDGQSPYSIQTAVPQREPASPSTDQESHSQNLDLSVTSTDSPSPTTSQPHNLGGANSTATTHLCTRASLAILVVISLAQRAR